VIVLDASVLIAHLDAEDAHHARAGVLLAAVAGEELCASPLTLAEVLVGPARGGRLDVARTALEQLGIRGVALADDAPARLATLCAETSLKLPDCCILLTAGQVGGAVGTFDERLAAAGRQRGLLVTG